MNEPEGFEASGGRDLWRGRTIGFLGREVRGLGGIGQSRYIETTAPLRTTGGRGGETYVTSVFLERYKEPRLFAVCLPRRIDLEASAEKPRDPNLAAFEGELRAFHQMHPDLLSTHAGLFVAIHNGRVVDQDADELALARRLEVTYPKDFVLIRQVGAAEAGESSFMSPHEVDK